MEIYDEDVAVRLKQTSTVNRSNVQRLRNRQNGYAIPLDLAKDKDIESGSSDYVDTLGKHLVSTNILLASGYNHECYLIEGFSVRLSYLANEATALAVLSYQDALKTVSASDMSFNIYNYDASLDGIMNDIRLGSTAIFLRNSLPCFGTRNRYNSTWGRNQMVAVLFKDEFDLLAA